MRPIVVTGTDTGVGKTIVTAALAAAGAARGLRVAVVKPTQSGLGPDGVSDMDIVTQLAGVHTRELVRYPDPLAPLTAARVSNQPELSLGSTVDAIRKLDHDLVLVEGAGGLLVAMGEGGWTIADLTRELNARCVVVTRPDLGTLNHTALTLEALARRELDAHLVIGSWPRRPELVHHTNLDDLPPWVGKLPENAGTLPVREFRERASGWFIPGFLAGLFAREA
ncbi:MAG: ATP-dependent dethiobiotin synthetase BioD [Longispora sp.]|nr:ATP-dependent dethiobiotin synthetase BioD [Longispora sp. (in: high G+C Gram-positive bacteria)]